MAFPEKRLRVLVSTPTFLPLVGGAELGIHEIYTRLGQRHDVTILTPRYRAASIEAYGAIDYAGANYKVTYLAPQLDWIWPRIVGRALRRTSLPYLVDLIGLVRRCGADCINFHFVRPHGFALIVMSRVFRIQVLLSLVGRPDVLSALGLARRLYARAVIGAADGIAPISDFCLGPNYSSPKVDVIPYGVDTSEFTPERRSAQLRHRLGVRTDQFLLFSVQRLAPVKRVDVQIRVMDALRSRGVDAVLVIGGQGEESKALHQLAEELRVDDHIRFAGYISATELPAYFASADAFVFHSLFETFGIVFAQAMASALPIIAANSSCVPEVVKPDNGILVEPFAIQDFCDAVIRLASEPGLREAIGARNRLRATREFSWDSIADRYETALLSLAHTPPTGSQSLNGAA